MGKIISSTEEIWEMTKQEQWEVLMHENNDDLVDITETGWDNACD